MPATPLVLDSFALLAYFRGEAAGLGVRDLMDQAATTGRPLFMSEVNYAEFKYILLRKDGEDAWERARDVLESLPLEFVPVTHALADAAADFKAAHALSLADAFAAALAREKKAELVTGDPEFKALEKQIRIRWVK